MDAILLTYFDNVLGPTPFLIVPLNLRDDAPSLPTPMQRDIAALIDTITTEGFFSHGMKDANTANYFIKLNSIWGRGGQELVCVSILTTVRYPEIFKGVLATFTQRLQKIPDIYKAFYTDAKPKDKETTRQKEVLTQYLRNFASDVARIKEESTAGKILVLGLEQAGKTCLVHSLNGNTFSQNEKPTLGLNITKIVLSEVELFVYDCGGQKSFRDQWVTTLNSPHALVFVIDLSDEDPARLTEAQEEFWRILNHFGAQKQEQFPVLVLGNKVDLVKKPNEKDLARLLNLEKLKDRPVHVGLTSARTGLGVQESFKWLVTQLINT